MIQKSKKVGERKCLIILIKFKKDLVTGFLRILYIPVPKTLRYLVETKHLITRDNRLLGISYAVSDKSGEISVKFKEDNIAISSVVLNITEAKELTVKSITIDEFVETNKISKVDFIKADIEGAE